MIPWTKLYARIRLASSQASWYGIDQSAYGAWEKKSIFKLISSVVVVVVVVVMVFSLGKLLFAEGSVSRVIGSKVECVTLY